jgi:hypothetical protein
VAGITHGLMGLEVNRKVKRIDMLQGGLRFEIIKTYYNEIAIRKKLPIVFILFVCSAILLAGEIVWFKVIKGGYLTSHSCDIIIGTSPFSEEVQSEEYFRNAKGLTCAFTATPQRTARDRHFLLLN